MGPSSSLFTSGPLAARRSADLLLAWLDAAEDVQDAYVAWLGAERADRANGFAVYQAALDREEAAAGALKLQSRVLCGLVRSS
jgi:hypothetical protein